MNTIYNPRSAILLLTILLSTYFTQFSQRNRSFSSSSRVCSDLQSNVQNIFTFVSALAFYVLYLLLHQTLHIKASAWRWKEFLS